MNYKVTINNLRCVIVQPNTGEKRGTGTHCGALLLPRAVPMYSVCTQKMPIRSG